MPALIVEWTIPIEDISSECGSRLLHHPVLPKEILVLTVQSSMTILRTMIRVTYHLTESQVATLRAKSKESGLSVAELIRRAVDGYFEKPKKNGAANEKRSKA